MVNCTLRLPVALLRALDEAAEAFARQSGVRSINRSDLARSILERGLVAK